VARFKPFNWTVEAGREALTASPDLGYVTIRMAGLVLVTLLAAALATRAFRSYQRSA
jgi:ABC-2 type transport system permease protein